MVMLVVLLLLLMMMMLLLVVMLVLVQQGRRRARPCTDGRTVRVGRIEVIDATGFHQRRLYVLCSFVNEREDERREHFVQRQRLKILAGHQPTAHQLVNVEQLPGQTEQIDR